jgi:hypothetical protein
LRKTTGGSTYRCEEYEGLLEITEVSDVLLTYASGNVLDKRVKVFEGLLGEDGLDNEVVDLLARVLTKHVILLWRTECGKGPGDSRVC